jgi:hypothetical protein
MFGDYDEYDEDGRAMTPPSTEGLIRGYIYKDLRDIRVRSFHVESRSSGHIALVIDMNGYVWTKSLEFINGANYDGLEGYHKLYHGTYKRKEDECEEDFLYDLS